MYVIIKYIYVCVYLCVYICVCVSELVSMYVCVCVCVCVCMYVLMYVGFYYAYIDINTLALGIKSFLASQVWVQAIAGARTYGTDLPTMYVCIDV